MPKDSYQLDLFSTSKPTYRIAKPIRLIEGYAEKLHGEVSN